PRSKTPLPEASPITPSGDGTRDDSMRSGPATSPTSTPARGGSTWPRSATATPGACWAGRWTSAKTRAWWTGRCAWPTLCAETSRMTWCSTPTAESSTPRRRCSIPARSLGFCSRWGGPGCAGTTRWPSRSGPRWRPSSTTAGSGRPGPRPAERSPGGSRSSTTVAGCTPASTTPARSRSRKLSNTARSRLKNTLIRPKPLDQLSTTCGQAQRRVSLCSRSLHVPLPWQRVQKACNGSRPPRWGASADPFLNRVDAVADDPREANEPRSGTCAAPVREGSGGDFEVLDQFGRCEELRQLHGGSLRPWHGALQSSWAPGWRPRLYPVGGRFLSGAIPARHTQLPPMTDVGASTMWTMPVLIPQPLYGAQPRASSIFGAFRGPQGACRDE